MYFLTVYHVIYCTLDTYQTDDATTVTFTNLAASIEGFLALLGADGVTSHQHGDVFSNTASAAIDTVVTRKLVVF